MIVQLLVKRQTRDYFFCKWAGSTVDSTIWNLSGVKTVIKEYIESRGSSFKGWLIGDSGYPQREEMLVPLLEFNTANIM